MMRNFGLLTGLIAVLSTLLTTGCHTESFTDPIIGPVYAPRNVFRRSIQFPANIRRVAVLPLAYDANDPLKVSGREVLEQPLMIGLAKAQRFECIPVSREQLNQWTGREKWSSRDQLPPDLLATLEREWGCEAVLFCELTHYKPYSPLTIGWNFKLVEIKDQTILWAADETFDAGEIPVANAARLYQRSREKDSSGLSDSRQVLQSPRRFGQFTIDTLVETMPTRQYETIPAHQYEPMR